MSGTRQKARSQARPTVATVLGKGTALLRGKAASRRTGGGGGHTFNFAERPNTQRLAEDIVADFNLHVAAGAVH